MNATLDLPEGVVAQHGPLWVWSLVSVKYSATEATSEEDWGSVEEGQVNVGVTSNGPAQAFQYWTFHRVGFYQVKVKAVANVTIQGRVTSFEATKAVGN